MADEEDDLDRARRLIKGGKHLTSVDLFVHNMKKQFSPASTTGSDNLPENSEYLKNIAAERLKAEQDKKK
jgi:hypothetical protein